MIINFGDEPKGVVVKFVTSDVEEKETGFSGKIGETRVLYGNTNIIIMGVDLFDITAEYITKWKSAIATIVGLVKNLEEKEVTFEFPTDIGEEFIETLINETVAAAIYANHAFDKYKEKKDDAIETIHFINDEVDLYETLAIADAVNETRDLVEENASVATPAYIEQQVLNLVKDNEAVEVEILSGDAIKNAGLGLFYAVGQGSKNLPKLIIAKYTGIKDDEAVPYKALVGKGITYDTGGLDLKSTSSIIDMRTDMAGSAAVYGTLKALVDLDAEVNVVAVFACAENAIGSGAYYPGDIYKGYSGKTVEITNTDAEGRLVLADAISYTLDKYDIDELVDIATLTGACVYALGDGMAGLFSNNKSLAEDLFMVGEDSGDRVWELPIRPDHVNDMKSDRADLRNTGKRAGKGGAITAAAFIQEFVGETPWAHIDIAGTARGDIATGFGVALLTKYVLQ